MRIHEMRRSQLNRQTGRVEEMNEMEKMKLSYLYID